MTTSAHRLMDPTPPCLALPRHFALVVPMARRDVVGRCRGSFAGLAWSFFNALPILAVHAFVFGVVSKSRWNAQAFNPCRYAVVLFARCERTRKGFADVV